MGKAIEGAAMLGAAVGMGVAAFFDPALVASPLFDKIWAGLVINGLSMEVGAIADALTSNRGMNITTRQAASYRQVIYGMQRVGGVEVYRSTTGSHFDQFNYVIVLAGHECWGIQNLYLDGRQVYWVAGSAGQTTPNGANPFGGDADSNSHTGPNGVQYNFGSLVYCEARYGTQVSGNNGHLGVIEGLTANDPNWAVTSTGSPDLMGCTYVYLKVEADSNMFPGEPEVRFTVMGKPLLDPRTNTTTWTSNWALIANDIITDPEFGLGDNSVNQAQLIAAANVCDEQVPIAIGGTEARYSCHVHYDTSTSPGDALTMIMPAAAGRMSRIGGEWYLWPAYWQGPSFTFNESNLTGSVEWKPYRSFRDLFNRVTGTYTAPNFPWNIAGNLYDSNGFFNGQQQNNFAFAFQPTNYPQYAADNLHGYASDEFLNEDGGKQLPKELSLNSVLSVSQAQRIAKIYLLRNRQQGSGTFHLDLAAYQMQPTDTLLFSFAANGWVDKVLEVNSVKFQITEGNPDTPPTIRVQFELIETAETVYEWSTAEELTVYSIPAVATQLPWVPAPPTNMTLISSAGTALVNPDGSVVPRIEVTWDTPLDGLVKQIQMQYQPTGAAVWNDAGLVDVSLNLGYISPVVAGTQYNVRIRSLRSTGAFSAWEEIDGFTAGLVLAIQTQDGYGLGSLVGEAYSDGTAAIECNQFTALVGQLSLPIFPGGAVTISGLAQQTLYYVYYIDPTYVGGNVTPIATTNQSDYLSKLGYFLIASIVTPFASTSGGGGGGGGGTPGTGVRYYPSAAGSQDIGTRTTSNPTLAFDGNLNTVALVSGQSLTKAGNTTTAFGDFIVAGFPSITPSVPATLTVVASASVFTAGSTRITATINGVQTSLLNATTVTPSATYTCPIPTGTQLSAISVEFVAMATTSPTAATSTANIEVVEVYVQT